jgi:carbamoyltransferase
MKITLGISAYFHDSAAALIADNQIIGAAQEERFTRRKGDANFPTHAILNLLKSNNLSLDDITNVGYYEIPELKLDRITSTLAANFPGSVPNMFRFLSSFNKDKFFPQSDLRQLLQREVPISFFPHHTSHAASAYFPSPFSEAAVLTMDGVGEWATSTIFSARENRLSQIKEMRYPDSVGLLYAAITSFCGFKVNSGEYKLMGLAPYGKPRYKKVIEEKVVQVFQDGSISLNLDYFGYLKTMKMFNERRCAAIFDGPAREPESEITQRDCDLASSVQSVLEEIVIRQARHALEVTHSKHLCLAGGVALNCVANSRILEFIDVENVFVQPASGDAGGALGAGLLAALSEKEKKTNVRQNGSFLGTSISDPEIIEVINKYRLKSQKFDSMKQLNRIVSQLLTQGQVIGWVQGKMEFGPRALGGRSILADARNPEMQKTLNLRIKKRESFRPFAPVVLAENAHEWFEWPENKTTPFMLFTAPVKRELRKETDSKVRDFSNLTTWISEIRSQISAVTHLDYSARIQTIDSSNPLYGLLQEFKELTACPVLVNTSFNVRNEPIVESAEDAIKCFLSTDMDTLVLGMHVIEKMKQTNLAVDQSELMFRGEND